MARDHAPAHEGRVAREHPDLVLASSAAILAPAEGSNLSAIASRSHCVRLIRQGRPETKTEEPPALVNPSASVTVRKAVLHVEADACANAHAPANACAEAASNFRRNSPEEALLAPVSPAALLDAWLA